MDVLNDRLMRARATGAVFARTVATPPWGLQLGGDIQLAVHTVTSGRAWLWIDEDAAHATELLPGQISLVRGGPPHFIAHEPGAPCLDPQAFRTRQRKDADPDDPGATVFLCGAYQFAGDIGGDLLAGLPPILTFASTVDSPLRDVITLLSRELAVVRPGQQTVLDRLLDVLLVLALRHEFDHSPDAPRWYQAASDPRLQAALRAIHENPDHPWTVPELAALSGLSRATFARIFRDVLGQAPLQYLTEWRMALARDHLRTHDRSLASIGRAIGYGSQYAFTTAFRRHHGLPPGAWRQQQPPTPLTSNDVHGSG